MKINNTKLYEVFWTFFLGGVLGVCIETVWCYFAFGGFSSRTSNLFFPFSIVWALGALGIQLFLSAESSESTVVLFVKGCLFCGCFEFLCGFIGQLLLGVTFWDYTELPFHIGKYVNVIICLLWGVMCIFWKKMIYPYWVARVQRFLKHRSKRILTICMIVFMVITNVVSGMALIRMNERNSGIIADTRIKTVLDTYFNDQLLQVYFPKMKFLNGEKVYQFSEDNR